MTTLTLIGKPDCHLCDVARDVVEAVVAELPEDAVATVAVDYGARRVGPRNR